MVADLSNQFEQQFGTLFVIDFRLCTQLFQYDLFRIVALKIDCIALDALPVLHILQILNEQLILDRHMGKICYVQIKVYEHIFLNTGIRYLDTGNRNKFVHGSSVRFLGLVEHPCCQRHFILLEGLSQILILSDLLFDCFYNLLCLHRGDRMRRGMLNVLFNLCFDQVSCLLDQCICGIRLFNLSMSIRFFQLGIRIGFYCQLSIDHFFGLDFFCFNDIPSLKNRITLLCLRQNIIEFLMGSQHDGIHIPITGALSIGQAQAATYHLLSQNFGCGRPKRNDGIEVVDVPTFFEHIDMDHDLHRIFRIFHIQKQTSVRFGLCAFLFRVDDDCFVAICATTEFV